MSSILANWKTTLAGAAVIATSIGIIFTNASNGHLDANTTWTAVMAILGGLGLGVAKDGSN